MCCSRIAQIYRIERELAEMPTEERLAGRMNIARPLWEQLRAWLRLERGRVPDGSATAKVRISAKVTDDFGNVTGLSGRC